MARGHEQNRAEKLAATLGTKFALLKLMYRSLCASLLCLVTSAACGSEPLTNGPPTGEGDGGTRETDASNEATREADVAPGDWKRVQGGCGISMRAPTLVTKLVAGIDSCVASFVAPGCTYFADVGGYSDPLTASGANVERVRVAGRVARLVTDRLPETGQYFVGIHFAAPLWPGGDSVSATIGATCNGMEEQQTARLVLQTIELPADSSAAATKPQETTSCIGEDNRAVTGYRLGRSCVEESVAVPGTCALGAKSNGATGNGPMVCFVSTAGEYYWAHVAFGETIGGTGSRHGWAEVVAISQLEPAEEARCQELVAMLGEAQRPPLGGDLRYQVCP